jgi:hypothetical protein
MVVDGAYSKDTVTGEAIPLRKGGPDYKCSGTCPAGQITIPGATHTSNCTVGYSARWNATEPSSCAGTDDNIGYQYITSKDDCDKAIQMLADIESATPNTTRVVATSMMASCGIDPNNAVSITIPCEQRDHGTRNNFVGVCGIEHSSHAQFAVFYSPIDANQNRSRPIGTHFVAICQILACNIHEQQVVADGSDGGPWMEAPKEQNNARCELTDKHIEILDDKAAFANKYFIYFAMPFAVLAMAIAYFCLKHKDKNIVLYQKDADSWIGYSLTPECKWILFGVGMRFFDMETDWGFYFINVRNPGFKASYDRDGDDAESVVFSARYEGFRNASLVVCIFGLILTPIDIWGNRQRTKGRHSKAMSISAMVFLWEDAPQLLFNIKFMYIKKALDNISILSLTASIFNIVYNIGLIVYELYDGETPALPWSKSADSYTAENVFVLREMPKRDNTTRDVLVRATHGTTAQSDVQRSHGQKENPDNDTFC